MDGGYPHRWHINVEASSGFKRRTTQKKKASNERFPEEVARAMEESTPYYKYLEMRKIRPIKTETLKTY